MGDPNDPVSDPTRDFPPAGPGPRQVDDLLAAAPTKPDGAPLGPGATIGRYKLLHVIGEGGFGVVYMAEQEHPIRRRVALKVIKLGMDTRQVIARFEAERQALSLMDHPSIAKVLDGGATDAGRPYFVMELVKGVPVTRYCDENRLGVRERLELFAQTCRAVQHAHQKGIIHRDIKPSNVLVAVSDGLPTPKVIDFGIAKALNQRLTEKTLFTEFQQFLGTPEYMSPEQAGLSGLDVDTRTDVYALGVLLYELLTGTTPFDPNELRSKAYAEIERIIREVEPPRPSTRLSTLGNGLTDVAARRRTDPRRLSRMVHGELDWIVMRCLEKDRTRRYDTANGLAMDVERYLRGEAVSAGPPSALYKLRRFVRRHRLGVAAACAVAASLLAALMAIAVSRSRAISAKLAISEQRTEAQGARDEAEAVTRYVQQILTAADPWSRGGRKDLTVREALDSAARSLDRGSLERQPRVEAAVRLTLGRAYKALGLFADAEPHLRRSLEIRQRLFGEQHPHVAECLDVLSGVIAATGRLAEAERMSRHALALRKQAFGDTHPAVVESLHGLGTVLWESGDLDAAESSLRDAVALCHKLPPDEAGSPSETLDALAAVLWDKGRWDDAEALHREALDMRRARVGDDHVLIAASLHNLASRRLQRGDVKQAESFFRDALDIRRRLLGDDHPEVGASLYHVAFVLHVRGDHRAAVPLLREALAVQRKGLGEGHPNVQESYGLLVSSLDRSGQRATADEVRREWRQKLRDVPPPAASATAPAPSDVVGNRRLALTYRSRAETHLQADDPMGGLEYHRKALAVLESASEMNPEDPSLRVELALQLYLTGKALWDGGDVATAAEHYHRCTGLSASLGPAAPRDTPARSRLYDGHFAIAMALQELACAPNLDVERRTEYLLRARDAFASVIKVTEEMGKAGFDSPMVREVPRLAGFGLAACEYTLAELKAPAGPFRGSPAQLPGVVEAEDFDLGGIGVAYLDMTIGDTGNRRGAHRVTSVDIDICGDVNGGCNVGGIFPGEWLAYSVDVASDGVYDIDLRVASVGGGSTLHVEFDGTDVTGPVELPNTGEWQVWQTVTKARVSLRKGQQAMRVVFDKAQSAPGTGRGYIGNLNWITVRPSTR